MQKLLISSKFSNQTHSDTPGGSISTILLANFFKKIFNYRVTLHDPFFNSKNLLKPFCDEVIDDLNIDYSNYQRIINPLFYKGSVLDKHNSKIYNVEGVLNIKKKFNIKKKNLQIISDQYYVSNKNNHIISKSFDIPYVYYYDWLARENFKPSVELNKLKEIPLIKNYITISIHIRKDNWKNYLNDFRGDEYDNFIKNLILQLKKKYIHSNIIIYGLDKKSNNSNLIDFLNEKKCVYLEDYSDYPLERAILLAKNTNEIYCTANGFSFFAQILGSLYGKLKKRYYINSEENMLDVLHSRRIFSDGIAEKNFIDNSYFWNKVSIIKKSKLNNFVFDLEKKLKNKKNKQVKYFIYYDIDNFNQYYFSNKIDKIIFQELIRQNKKLYKNHKILLIQKKSKKQKIYKKFDFSPHQHVLTHYNLIKKDYKNKKLLKGSLDFIKPTFLQNLIKEHKLNTSNLFYEDLLDFTYRECQKNEKIKLKSKIRNIIFIDSDETYKETNSSKTLDLKKIAKKIFKEFGLYPFISSINSRLFSNQDKDKIPVIKWSRIISKYQNAVGANCEVLIYKKNESLIHLNKNKKRYENFKIKKIKEILNKHDVIICRPNKFSLLIKFLYKNKVILLEENTESKYVINDNVFLSRNYSYLDIFKSKFNNFRELNYYLFKKHLVF